MPSAKSPEKPIESPVQFLRLYLEKDPELRSISTQTGFARLVGRSETLIRSLERNRAKMTRKLARKISEVVGADENWLMQHPVTGKSIPSKDGGELTHLEVACAISSHSTAPLLGKEKANPMALNIINRQMITGILSLVEAEMIDFCQSAPREVSDPFPEILEWLHKRSEKRSLFQSSASGDLVDQK